MKPSLIALGRLGFKNSHAIAGVEMPLSYVPLGNTSRRRAAEVSMTVHHPDNYDAVLTLQGQLTRDGLWLPSSDSKIDVAMHPAFRGLSHHEGYIVSDKPEEPHTMDVDVEPMRHQNVIAGFEELLARSSLASSRGR